jgi:hypothetical protein
VSFGEVLLNREAMVEAATMETITLTRAVVEVMGELAHMAQMAYRPDVPQHDSEDSLLAKEVLYTEVGLVSRHASMQLVEEGEASTISKSEDDDDQ